MKRKMTSVLLALAFCIAVGGSFGAGTVTAADCGNARVTQPGIYPALQSGGASSYIAFFECLDAVPAWSGPRQFVLSTDLGDAGYATLLTALALDKNVWIRVESVVARSLATIIYLNEQPQ
jgi:hypothetical protein